MTRPIVACRFAIRHIWRGRRSGRDFLKLPLIALLTSFLTLPGQISRAATATDRTWSEMVVSAFEEAATSEALLPVIKKSLSSEDSKWLSEKPEFRTLKRDIKLKVREANSLQVAFQGETSGLILRKTTDGHIEFAIPEHGDLKWVYRPFVDLKTNAESLSLFLRKTGFRLKSQSTRNAGRIGDVLRSVFFVPDAQAAVQLALSTFGAVSLAVLSYTAATYAICSAMCHDSSCLACLGAPIVVPAIALAAAQELLASTFDWLRGQAHSKIKSEQPPKITSLKCELQDDPDVLPKRKLSHCHSTSPGEPRTGYYQGKGAFLEFEGGWFSLEDCGDGRPKNADLLIDESGLYPQTLSHWEFDRNWQETKHYTSSQTGNSYQGRLKIVTDFTWTTLKMLSDLCKDESAEGKKARSKLNDLIAKATSLKPSDLEKVRRGVAPSLTAQPAVE